ncbi:hypothetical protein EYF80_054413 [Liparis tanakae]|uniref:Uncharacterized protein n=1 Tax=Liparis tanakae TaxID=230148 RepID=A0A4Z2F3G3_9TELE|nr:hypothetical protein EYF80_054413 [Liparis tanakae]
MAQITSDGAEQDSQATSDKNGTGETAETGKEGQAVPDPKQEPGDNNELRGGMDVNSGRGAAGEEVDHPAPAPGDGEESSVPTQKMGNDEGEPDGKLSGPGESPARGSSASSTDSAAAREGSSRGLKPEQRGAESAVSSPPADPTKPAEKAEPGARSQAAGERSAAGGEPLSRMDSEDRSVGAVCRGLEKREVTWGEKWLRDPTAALNQTMQPAERPLVARRVNTASFRRLWCQLLA